MATKIQLVLTHVAVFSVGAVAAWLGHSKDPASGEMDHSGRSRPGVSRVSEGRSLGENTHTEPHAKLSRTSISQKSSTSTAERFAEITRLTDPFDQQRALLEMAATLGVDEFQGVIDQYLSTDHLRGAREGLDCLLHGWAKLDPLAALDYAEAKIGSRDAANTVLASWAGTDPAAAEAWALSHHEGDAANPHLVGLIRGIAGQDLDAATRLIQTMPWSRERSDAIETITRALFVKGNDVALAYADTITDAALRGSFVASITKRLLRKDPTQAAAYVSAQPDGATQSRATKEVAEALVRKDLAQATTWVGTLKPDARAMAAAAIVPKMAENDIPATATWVSSLVGTPGYDRVVESFIWSCDTRSPEQSAEWIRAISDPKQQLKVYQKMLGDWSKKDPAAVKNWVSSHAVPAAVSARFIKP